MQLVRNFDTNNPSPTAICRLTLLVTINITFILDPIHTPLRSCSDCLDYSLMTCRQSVWSPRHDGHMKFVCKQIYSFQLSLCLAVWKINVHKCFASLIKVMNVDKQYTYLYWSQQQTGLEVVSLRKTCLFFKRGGWESSFFFFTSYVCDISKNNRTQTRKITNTNHEHN